MDEQLREGWKREAAEVRLISISASLHLFNERRRHTIRNLSRKEFFNRKGSTMIYCHKMSHAMSCIWLFGYIRILYIPVLKEIKSCWIDFENTKMQKDRAITYRAQVKQQHACSLQVDVEKGHRQALNQADKYLAKPHWAKWAQY